MLVLDSLVIDLIFSAGAELKPEKLVEAMGGEEIAASRLILDPDMQDPRFELELSPSLPMRRRGERRLLIIDDAAGSMRKDPRTEPIVPIDLRPEKERLLALCQAAPVRLGRLSALGSWGDAVLCARSAQDLRAVALLSWVLDPTVDVDGRKRANRLTQAEFETKVLAYDKRLQELDEKAILANLGPARLERRGEFLVVDVLEADGTWDVRKSIALENALAAIDQFSLIPGAPATPRPAQKGPQGPQAERAAGGKSGGPGGKSGKGETSRPEPPAAPAGPPLGYGEVGGRVVLIFPRERFDLDVAAALGKRDWDAVLRPSDLPGPIRDRVFRDGAGFIAPLEFLSEVFVDGKPLSRPQFDQAAQQVETTRARSLEVHVPRFGPALLLDVADRGRFISSELVASSALVGLVAQ
jgi:hypothetical protein